MINGWRLCALTAIILTIGCAPHVQHSTDVLDGSEPSAGGPVGKIDTLATHPDSLFEFITVASPLDTLLEDIPTLPDSSLAKGRERLEAQEEVVTFDVPIDMNDRVLTFIDRYSGKQASWFERAVRRSGLVMPMIRRVFIEEGVPLDLAYMAHVESAYRYNARSRAGAIGMWQFIRSTAKRYGLLCNSYVDERLDPERSTRAAAHYLKDLYELFDDWHLAMAAYNAGEGKVKRGLRRAGTDDFWKLARTRMLRRETRNYVPAILAAIILSKQPDDFGLEFHPDDPIEYDTIEVESVTHVDVIAECASVPSSVIRALNPALLASQTPPGHHPYEIRIPTGSKEQFATALAAIPPEDRMLYQRHVVGRGETLSHLAMRYGTTVSAIQQANGMGRRTMIRQGKTVLIPSGRWDPSDALASLLAPGERVTHRIRRGESLSSIARRYGTSVRAIQQWNDIPNAHRVRAGQTLTLFAGGPAPAPAKAKPTRSSSPEPGGLLSHTVRRGESLWSIARQYGLTVTTLRSLNGQLGGKNLLRPGQKLTVRTLSVGEAVVHRVAHGETLWDIASRYGTTVRNIRQWNGMGSRSSLIHPGDRLTLYLN